LPYKTSIGEFVIEISFSYFITFLQMKIQEVQLEVLYNGAKNNIHEADSDSCNHWHLQIHPGAFLECKK
jgi:hypothetical protein